MITPKWTGSMPMAVATGKSTGTMIVMAATVSMKHPTTRRIRLISNRIIQGRSDIVSRRPATVSGTRLDVRIHAKIDAAATTSRTTAVVSIVS